MLPLQRASVIPRGDSRCGTCVYRDGMRTTIDKAGRIVIPASVRTRVGLRPGTELEVEVDDGTIRLVRVVPRAKLAREQAPGGPTDG